MKRTRLIIREISNYLYLKKTLNREARNSTLNDPWKKFNFRKNWFGRVYTVVSLREEDMGEEDMVRNWKAMEMMKPMNEYLTSLGLHEIIFPSIEKIPDTRSYLVVYSPLFKELTFGWIFWRLLLIVGVISSLYYFL